MSPLPTLEGLPLHRRIDAVFDELLALQRRRPEGAALAQFRSRVTAEQYRRFYRWVDAVLPPGSRVLDWGCGNGHASYGLTRMGFAVTGFAFEPAPLIPHCGPDYRFVRGDPGEPRKLPFPDGAFESVVSVGVLEHVRETGGTEEASLAEIRRVLRPGGVFLCFHLPNRTSLIEAVAARIPGKHHHAFRYGRADIVRLCQGAGLALVDQERYGALPRNLWHRAPRIVRNGRALARGWNGLDAVATRLLSPLCQNHLFVARRPESDRLPDAPALAATGS